MVAEGMLNFAELVARLDLPLPDLTGVDVVAQPYCHQSEVGKPRIRPWLPSCHGATWRKSPCARRCRASGTPCAGATPPCGG